MWVFERLTTPGVHIRLLVGEDYQVGRKDCRITVLKDQSVSRKHAVLRVNHPEGHLGKPSHLPTVELNDSSKFGTIVNGSMITLGSTVKLKDGDLVTFGAMNTNKWKLSHSPLVVAFSSIASSEKKMLKALVLSLGGHVSSEWSKDCTHLIMTQLSVTLKVTAALITCCPIVTPQYLHKVKEAAQCDAAVPETNNFRPPVVEEAIDAREVSFDPNSKRLTIFKDKTFIFVAEKQIKQLGRTIELGGGKAILMEEGDSQVFSMMTNAGIIVMYADPEDSSQALTQETQYWIRDVMQHLKKHGLRPIPVSELGLAVLYASTELHCNPKVAQAGLNLLSAVPSQPTLEPVVLASDTQASCSKPSMSVASNNDRSCRSAGTGPKVAGSSSVADERKLAQQTKKRTRHESVPETTPKVPKLELPSPAHQGITKPSHTKEAEVTPYKSLESLLSGPSLKTSPEFSFVGRTSPKSTHSLKQEVVSPQADIKECRKVTEFPMGQMSDVKDDEENMELGSDHEPSPMKVKGHSSTLESANRKSNGKQPKKGRADTLGSIWDSNVDGDRQREIKEEVVAEEEEERVVDYEPIAEKLADDVANSEESQNTKWRRKQKRNVLDRIEVDEARESQLSQEQEGERPDFSQVLSDVPGGFLTAVKPPKEEQAELKSESNGELATNDNGDVMPQAVITIELSLVIRRPRRRQAQASTINGRSNIKNFKRFRKAAYAGQKGMPQIIGGRDLEKHSNRTNDEIDDMMFGGYQAEQKKTKDEELAEKLFADEPRGRKGRRR